MKLREDVSFRLPSFSVRLSDIRQNPALTVNQVFVPARIPLTAIRAQLAAQPGQENIRPGAPCRRRRDCGTDQTAPGPYHHRNVFSNIRR